MSEKFHEKTDGEILDITGQLRAKFMENWQELKDIQVPKLPSTMTPADLHRLYEINAELTAQLFRAANIVTYWHRLNVEASALLSARETEHNRTTFGFIINRANGQFVDSYKSEAQKLAFAEDHLKLEGFKNLSYLASLIKGWHSQTQAIYARLERQADAVLTQLGILKSELNIHRP